MGRKMIRKQMGLKEEGLSESDVWPYISSALYKKELADEIAAVMGAFKVQNILSCGISGAMIEDFGKRNFRVVGVDKSEKVVEQARKYHSHENVNYLLMDWLDLDKVKGQFDAIVCRRSLEYVLTWDFRSNNDKAILTAGDVVEIRTAIERSIGIFYGKLKRKGILYIDTVPESEIAARGAEFGIEADGVNLTGIIDHDNNHTRHIIENGTIRMRDKDGIFRDKKYHGASVSYALGSNETMDILKKYFPEDKIWMTTLPSEKHRDIVLAFKP
jgi:hypothetical protein